MAKVYIPSMWRDLTGEVAQLELEGNRLSQIVEALESRFPGMRERLVDDGHLAAGLAVSIDGVVTSRGLLAPVPPQGEVHFLPAIGGGC